MSSIHLIGAKTLMMQTSAFYSRSRLGDIPSAAALGHYSYTKDRILARRRVQVISGIWDLFNPAAKSEDLRTPL